MIPYGKQDITKADINSVIDVLTSDWLTQGPKVPEFEKQIANVCQAKFAIAANSATSSLHLACLALGVGEGDAVWTSPISFVASANCALYCGAKVDFVDVNLHTANMCPLALKDKLQHAEQNNSLPKVIIVVHMGGLSCDMEAISALAKQYKISLIEDSSHAIGGKYQDSPIGCCHYSDISIFSFHPVKIITTAEGGVATTNNHKLAEKMSLLRSHGVTKDKCILQRTTTDEWYYEQHELGFNYRMTELNAALGLSQLVRINDYIAKRHEIAQTYINALSHLPITFQQQQANYYSAYHLMLVRINKDSSISRKELFNYLRNKGIGVNVHYIPIHQQPYFQNLGFSSGDFPKAELYYSQCISIPLHPTLTNNEISTIIQSIKDAFKPFVSN